MVHMITDRQDPPIWEMMIKIRLCLMLGNPQALKKESDEETKCLLKQRKCLVVSSLIEQR